MQIPGFTAEAALYEKSANYRTSRTHIQAGGAVQPATACEACSCRFDPALGFPVPTCAKLCVDHVNGEPYVVECDPSDCDPPCPPCCSLGPPGCFMC